MLNEKKLTKILLEIIQFCNLKKRIIQFDQICGLTNK
jgi:hypothetical protein